MEQFILNKLIEKFPTQTLAELKPILEKIENIRTKLRMIKFDKQRILNEYKEDMEGIEIGIQQIQKSCNHELTKYYPDASGNNDSSTECLICGKEL